MDKEFKEKEKIFKEMISRYPELSVCQNQIKNAYQVLEQLYEDNGILYVAGNGGSAADSEHIVGELMKSFMAKRGIDDNVKKTLIERFQYDGERIANKIEGGLPAVSLPSLVALSTAVSNDISEEMVFAQMLNSIGKRGDVFWGISTSGNSKNIVAAMMLARAKEMVTIGMCGLERCKLDSLCDVVIHVPEKETYKVQELHLPIYHTLCAMLESHFWRKKGKGICIS